MLLLMVGGSAHGRTERAVEEGTWGAVGRSLPLAGGLGAGEEGLRAATEGAFCTLDQITDARSESVF